MTLTHILVFSLCALLAGWAIPQRRRAAFMLVASLLAVYWLQPSTPIRHLDFWIPTTSIILVAFVWAVTLPKSTGRQRLDLIPALLIGAVILAAGLGRYVSVLQFLSPSTTPQFALILSALFVSAVAVAIPYLWPSSRRYLSGVAIAIILGLFITLKTPALATTLSAWLRSASGQSSGFASPLDLPWLGFSYLAFRLLQILRDSQAGKLPASNLGETSLFALFFPAYTAGPIDRSQRFTNELRRITTGPRINEQAIVDTIAGTQRILVGAFKKFVLADSLALIALNPQNAGQVTSTAWMWVLLLAYALRIYCDFSGYTDIAIGIGRLMGFHLPENFDRPYLRQNLTAFWNSWHMTLAQWFRAYYFNPLTRSLRTRPRKWPAWAIILTGQLTTMALIGLWHGVTLNFLAWGLWHGVGLFIHNRWSDWVRPNVDLLEARPALKTIAQFSGWLLTFLFVSLGWVWFALPEPGLAWQVFQKLFGFR